VPEARKGGILVVPDLNSGNMLARQMEYPACTLAQILAQHAQGSGLERKTS